MTFVESMFCHLKNAQRQGLSICLLFCIILTLQLVYAAATSHPSDDQPPKSKVKEGGFWKKFDWWLMCALAIPVILETLDYTGKSFLFVVRLSSHLIGTSSRRHCATSNCSKCYVAFNLSILEVIFSLYLTL
jgi:hypothetical protein